jgi:hypothetical protein
MTGADFASDIALDKVLVNYNLGDCHLGKWTHALVISTTIA